jgi:hypothetical protein
MRRPAFFAVRQLHGVLRVAALNLVASSRATQVVATRLPVKVTLKS